jgi:alkylation response protein AidB-like acyl-CoA dehydrogenase
MNIQSPTASAAVAPATLVERARALVPLLAERAAETEKQRRASDEIVETMRAADLYRVLQPKRYGGFEQDFHTVMDITCELGRGCPSTAWVYSGYAVSNFLIALFPAEAQEEVWGDDREARCSGSYAPIATTRFASGIDGAQWAVLGVIFEATEQGGRPKPGFLLVPARDFTLDDDWHTIGLAGTGSKTIVATDLFVPAHRAVTFDDLRAGTTPGSRVHANPLYRTPFNAISSTLLISSALGGAQGAAEVFLASIEERSTRGGAHGAGARVAEFPTVQIRYAEATACLDAARLLLRRDLDEVRDTIQAGEQVSVATRIRCRRDHGFALDLAVRAVEAVYAGFGGQGLYTHHALQRFWRDVRAAGKHVSYNWDVVATMYGQHAFGLEPKGQY